MNQIVLPEDITAVISSFLDVSHGNKDETNLILSIGAELLDVSADTMLELCRQNKQT